MEPHQWLSFSICNYALAILRLYKSALDINSRRQQVVNFNGQLNKNSYWGRTWWWLSVVGTVGPDVYDRWEFSSNIQRTHRAHSVLAKARVDGLGCWPLSCLHTRKEVRGKGHWCVINCLSDKGSNQYYLLSLWYMPKSLKLCLQAIQRERKLSCRQEA